MYPRRRRLSFVVPAEEFDVILNLPENDDPAFILDLNLTLDWIIPDMLSELDDSSDEDEISDAEHERNMQKLQDVAKSLEALAREFDDDDDQVVPNEPQRKRRRIDEPSTSTAEDPMEESFTLDEKVNREIDRILYLSGLQEEEPEPFVDEEIEKILAETRNGFISVSSDDSDDSDDSS